MQSKSSYGYDRCLNVEIDLPKIEFTEEEEYKKSKGDEEETLPRQVSNPN